VNRRPLAVLAGLLALGYATTACGGDANTGATPAQPKSTVTATATVTVTPEPPKQQGIMRPGQFGNLSFGRATALKLDPEVPVDYLEQKRWAAALVKVCVTKDTTTDGEPVELSWYPWAAGDAGGGTYGITDVTGGVTYPLPTYPTDPKRVVAGQCIKGWVTFNVAPAAKLTTVTYTPSGEQPLTWKF
jgi:hypothetical protein